MDKGICKTSTSKQVLKRENQIVSLPNSENTATNETRHKTDTSLNTEIQGLMEFTMDKKLELCIVAIRVGVKWSQVITVIPGF